MDVYTQSSKKFSVPGRVYSLNKNNGKQGGNYIPQTM
jgi:hypothetical protein